MWDYRAKLLEVHDGDTIKLLIDNGLGSRQEEWIRLKDVHAPELSQLGGKETRIFVVQWLGFARPDLVWPLYVMTQKNNNPEPTEVRTFARYVGSIALFNADPAIGSLNSAVINFLAQHPEWPPGM